MPTMTTAQVANLFKVHSDTIRTLVVAGELKPTVVSPQRFTEADVRAFMARNQVNA